MRFSMKLTNPKSQPNTCLQYEFINQSNKQENQAIHLINDSGTDYQKEKKLKQSKTVKEFQYKLITSRKNNEKCFAFAFNTNEKILFLACRKTIFVYINGLISKILMKLTKHTDLISCLLFIKNCNSLISGSYDNSIIIWKHNKFNQWTVSQQLQDHTKYVLCVLMNQNVDLLISGSYDKTVKFWRKIDNKWNFQQTIGVQDYSCSVSLNVQEDKLISCGVKPFIQIMQVKQDKTWRIVQTVEVSEKGFRLGFLNARQFVFQPNTKDFIELYQFDNDLRQFKKHKNFKIQSCKGCDWFFPIQFINDLKIVSVKHGRFLNILRVQNDYGINLIQTIDFKDEILYGNLSDNGKYLVTWDFKYKKLQIRQLRYLE